VQAVCAAPAGSAVPAPYPRKTDTHCSHKCARHIALHVCQPAWLREPRLLSPPCPTPAADAASQPAEVTPEQLRQQEALVMRLEVDMGTSHPEVSVWVWGGVGGASRT
jgi:hypothetical protein